MNSRIHVKAIDGESMAAKLKQLGKMKSLCDYAQGARPATWVESLVVWIASLFAALFFFFFIYPGPASPMDPLSEAVKVAVTIAVSMLIINLVDKYVWPDRDWAKELDVLLGAYAPMDVEAFKALQQECLDTKEKEVVALAVNQWVAKERNLVLKAMNVQDAPKKFEKFLARKL